MKIHTDLTAADMETALDNSGIEGASLLMQEKKSRSKSRRFDIYFDAEPSTGRRPSQHYDDGRQVTGITWDEWGLFIEQVYRADPTAQVGPYKSHAHFRVVNDWRFDDLTWEEQCPRHRYRPNGDGTMTCEKCDSLQMRPTDVDRDGTIRAH